MARDASRPNLRLVGGEGSEAWAHRAPADGDVAAENRAAAMNRGLEPTDPRWVIAAHARSQLQGSVLTPDRRQRVHERARRLGLRNFETNVILALVQDQARRGAAPGEMLPTLSMLPDPRARRVRTPWLRFAVAAACGITGALILIQWVMKA